MLELTTSTGFAGQYCGSTPWSAKVIPPSGVEPPESSHTGPTAPDVPPIVTRSEEHTSELQSLRHLVCRLLLEKNKKHKTHKPRLHSFSLYLTHTTYTLPT